MQSNVKAGNSLIFLRKLYEPANSPCSLKRWDLSQKLPFHVESTNYVAPRRVGKGTIGPLHLPKNILTAPTISEECIRFHCPLKDERCHDVRSVGKLASVEVHILPSDATEGIGALGRE